MSSTPTADAPLLSLRGIAVRFGTTRALDGVDLDVAPGEVRAILGENGAGKSTLMNVIYGLTKAAGEMRWQGEPVHLDSPLQAQRMGIGMVHQEFALIDALTVTENLALAGGEAGAVIDFEAVRQRARMRACDLGLDIGDLDARTGDLPVGVRQRVEILRAVMRDVRLLILDEPTAVLTPAEVEQLFAVLRSLAARGVAILLITHKLPEVVSLADSVTILRRGRVVGERAVEGTDATELAVLMVGRDVPQSPPDEPSGATSHSTLRAEGISVRAAKGALHLDDVDLDVRAGEILGIAGVDGNGQQELFGALAGLLQPSSGTIWVGDDGVATGRHDRRQIGRAGVTLIPPDRRREGAALEMSLWENAILDDQLLDEHCRRGILDRPAAQRFAAELVERFRIVCSGVDATAASLSGGNLQKLIVARALARRPRLVLTFNPTRGLDIGAAQEVHTALRAVLGWGGSVLLLSTDLDEITALSHRVRVLYRGRLGPPMTQPFDRAALGRMMGGLEHDGSAAGRNDRSDFIQA